MNEVLLVWDLVEWYIGNVTLLLKFHEEYLQYIRTLLERLVKHGLSIVYGKCQVGEP